MTTTSSGVQTDLSKVVHSCRPIWQLSEPQGPTVCISITRPTSVGDRCPEHELVGSLPYIYPPTVLLHRVIKNTTMQLPPHSNCTRLARDALVLGPRDPTQVTSVYNTSQAVPQPNVSQQPTTSEPSWLVFRSGQLQEQGFSVDVADRIADPQRSSTQTVYKSKWAQFETWCREYSVSFFTTSVKQISK